VVADQLQELLAGKLALIGHLVPFDLMKFTLTYQGPLLAASNNATRAKEKWEIRKALRPQLVKLWQTHPVLMGFGIKAHVPLSSGISAPSGNVAVTFSTTSGTPPATNAPLTTPMLVRGQSFLPIVRESMGLACGLNVIFLRQEDPGSAVKQGGDLDNRLKTLFDGLRVPNDSDLDAGWPDADPFHCLLEQDALITGVHIETDRLLTGPSANVHEVHLIIEVTVRVIRITMENLGFLGD